MESTTTLYLPRDGMYGGYIALRFPVTIISEATCSAYTLTMYCAAKCTGYVPGKLAYR